MPRSTQAARALTREVPAEVKDTPRSLGYRMPAEWEAHAATWLAFPHEVSDWPGKFEVVPWVFAEIAKKLTQGERVRLIVRDAKQEKIARSAFKRVGADL